MTCTKQLLLFQNTPYNLHNFLHSLGACFRYIQLYLNANALYVDQFSTRCNGTKLQLYRKGKSNSQGNIADIGYNPIVLVG
jgi:hypothetical protein